MHSADRLPIVRAIVRSVVVLREFTHAPSGSINLEWVATEASALSKATSSPRRKVKLKLSAQAEKYARPDAPLEARKMAARGALPLEPIELATVLFVLSNDPQPEVKETARHSLETLPAHVLDIVLQGLSHPALLSFLAHVHKENEANCEAIALNNQTEDATIAWLASLPHGRVIDIISQNQQRMLRSEEIVDALGANPLTGRAVIERILSFLGLEERETTDDEDDVLAEEEAQAAVLEMLGGDMADIARLLVSERESEGSEDESGNLLSVIQNMSVMQKIKLARVGGKEARSLLIRDRNRIVSRAVLASPKITETEIVTITQNRSTGDEILRVISNNREWTKNYQIKLALTMNPKTPIPQAVKFMNYIQDRDLRKLMKSKDVPSNISAHARRILTKKGKL